MANSQEVLAPRRTWDLVLTIVELVLLVAVGFTAVITTVALAAVSGTMCAGSTTCTDASLAGPLWIGVLVPVLIVVVAVVASIVMLVRRVLTFWVPIVGFAVIVAGWLIVLALLNAATASA